MPRIESGDTVGLDIATSADVPVLPKSIRCVQQPQCDSFRQGLGCDHAMSKTEMLDWLEKLRGHRISLESGGTKRTSKPKVAAARKDDTPDEF